MNSLSTYLSDDMAVLMCASLTPHPPPYLSGTKCLSVESFSQGQACSLTKLLTDDWEVLKFSS